MRAPATPAAGPPSAPGVAGRTDCAGRSYAGLRARFLADGHVTFTSCSLRRRLDAVAALVGALRTNAARNKQWLRQVASDADTMALMQYIHGTRPLPFQTLAFRNGTERRTHSDVLHFDTLPARGRMAASWVALEDVHPSAGPLHYYSRSHLDGLWDYGHLGLEARWLNGTDASRRDPDFARDYAEYQDELQRAIDARALERTQALLRRGETFLWAASLLHGGSPIEDRNRTRLSVASHYFFRPDAPQQQFYWVPSVSRLADQAISVKGAFGNIVAAGEFRDGAEIGNERRKESALLPVGYRLVDSPRIDVSC